ncbi:nuclear transport factor 2 family protein [Thalassomonas viridans]|uniref:Nuclear transport factor 2 family protein n=1 Tax=Thalassomonas viridans TaxID=137584 RepID=A0AAE9Z3H0_9GAMM|nr:nuclear transport factor 2 family protein [Thalassomonas viridans]WDE05935.1 nuclear transport factor 2 family protein [Thalassomonas viridans]
MNEQQKTDILAKVTQASETWKNAFNQGNAELCARQYTPGAVMRARPFGTFTGYEAIKAFWQDLIDKGFSDVNYIEPVYEVIDEQNVLLSSRWRMNNAGGVIHKELWQRQADGEFKLAQDEFEVLE